MYGLNIAHFLYSVVKMAISFSIFKKSVMYAGFRESIVQQNRSNEFSNKMIM